MHHSVPQPLAGKQSTQGEPLPELLDKLHRLGSETAKAENELDRLEARLSAIIRPIPNDNCGKEKNIPPPPQAPLSNAVENIADHLSLLTKRLYDLGNSLAI